MVRARQFAFYLLRWQMSTPVLWLVVRQLGPGLEATILANLIGGSIFFWVDRLIFRARFHIEWELVPQGTCSDCGIEGRMRRLVLAPGGDSKAYDRREDASPEYRCSECSGHKLTLLRAEKRVSPAVAG